MKFSKAFTSLAVVLLLSSAAHSQSATATMSNAIDQTQSADVTTELTFRASNANSAMSMTHVNAIGQSAKSTDMSELADLIPAAAHQLTAEIGTEMAGLAAGSTKSFHTGVLKCSNVLNRRSITIKVSYNPRPIGGILNVRVDLVPVFNGIGGASRPVASRSFSQSVDNLDQSVVDAIVNRLSEELALETIPS